MLVIAAVPTPVQVCPSTAMRGETDGVVPMATESPAMAEIESESVTNSAIRVFMLASLTHGLDLNDPAWVIVDLPPVQTLDPNG